jgi:hypothetical protein
MYRYRQIGPLLLLILMLLQHAVAMAAPDPLPSWQAGDTKNSIISFVTAVTDKDGPDYVPPAERIATLDNDGTLWSEKPVYFQLLFAMERIKALAPQHPEWKTQQPFKAVLEDDHDALVEAGEKGLLQLVMASHSGMSTGEFSQIVTDWLATAQHPRFKRPYTELVYQPMLELLAYLRGYRVYAPLGRGGVRHPAGAGDRQQHQDPI